MGKDWDDDKGGRDNWIKWMKDIFTEAKRTLKPGGHCFVWALPRTSHWTATALEDAGFEIRDVVTHVFGSGFPKSHNIEKSLLKMGEIEASKKYAGFGSGLKPAAEFYILCRKPIDNPEQTNSEDLFKKYPASENWILCRKPLSEKTIADNVLKWGTGGINIEKSRIEFEDTKNPATNPKYRKENGYKVPIGGQENINGVVKFTSSKNEINTEGRFPSNFIHDGSDEVMEEFDKAGNRISGGGSKATTNKKDNSFLGTGFGGTNEEIYEKNEGSAARFFYCSKASGKEKNEGLDDYEIKINIDPLNFYIYEKQSYILWEKQGLKVTLQVDMEASTRKGIEGYMSEQDWLWNIDTFMNYIMDQFQKECSSIIKTEINSTTQLEILNSWMLSIINDYIADVSIEKMVGGSLVVSVEKQNTNQSSINQKKDGLCVGVKNVEWKPQFSIKGNKKTNGHPTIKPVKLMSYLINMITPPNGIVLDLFLGSGSTGVAAVKNGFNFIGIEKEPDYMEIAKARIEYAKNKLKDV